MAASPGYPNPKAGGCIAALILIPLQIIQWIVMIPVMIVVALVTGFRQMFGGDDKK
jgi:hypothetical protein